MTATLATAETVVAQNVFFYLIAAVMVIAALRVVTTSNMVHAAL
jgi:NADH:ubiquinone oxidoreductase subunit 6 (subunit J)